MNKDLQSEELDRKLVHCTDSKGEPYMWSAYKVKVSNKSLSFMSSWKNQTITFLKNSFMGDALKVQVKWDEVEQERCSLGHYHEKSRVTKKHESLTIQWENVEQLIEWLQRGSWSEVSPRKPAGEKLLEDLREFLMLINEKNLLPLSKAEVAKFVSRINNQIR